MKMRSFNNINALSSYIKHNCFNDILDEIGKKSVETMKKVTQEQVSGQTGQVIECIGVEDKTDDTITISWQDKGSWFSLSSKTYGQHMYAPWALENGKVWNISGGSTPNNPIYKPPTHLLEESKKIIEKDSQEIVKNVLRTKGFRV